MFQESKVRQIWVKSEAAAGGVLQEKVFLEISQNSQENTSARVSFLIKLAYDREFCSCNVQKLTLQQMAPPPLFETF